MTMIETTRLLVRRMDTSDAAFMLTLLNSPTWLQFIGDRGVQTLEDARRYILDGPVVSYTRYGFGFYLVARKECGSPVGICGIAQRDYLDEPDLGYAMLPEYAGQGYASEAAAAVLEYARDTLRLPRLLATTRGYNHGSARVMEKLGMRYQAIVTDPANQRELMLYSIDLNPVPF